MSNKSNFLFVLMYTVSGNILFIAPKGHTYNKMAIPSILIQINKKGKLFPQKHTSILKCISLLQNWDILKLNI